MLRILSVLFLVLTAPALAQEPAKPKLSASDLPKDRTTWFGVYVHGKKSGFAKETYKREADRLVVGMEFEFKLRSMGTDVEMKIVDRQEFALTAPFAYLGGRMVMQPGQDRTFVANGTTVTATTKVGSEDVRQDVEGVHYTLEEQLAMVLWLTPSRKSGDVITVGGFDSLFLKPMKTTFTLKSRSTRTVHGVKAESYTVRVVSSTQGEQGDLVLTGEGQMISMKFGGMIEMRQEPEALAKKLEKGGDLFFNSAVSVDKPLGNPQDVVELELWATGPRVNELPSGPRQSVVQKDGATLLRMAPDAGEVVATAEEIANCTQPDGMCPSDHPKVIALANKLVGDAATPREKTRRLTLGIYDSMAKVLRPQWVSVIELCDDMRGDCSEHSALFVACARAAGLAARPAVGLIYIGDRHKSLGGHAWAEVVLDGKWVPVDPSWGELEINATHIRMGAGSTSLGAMIHAFSGLKFEVKRIGWRRAPKRAPKKTLEQAQDEAKAKAAE
ncbi:MAG: transglutaminase-like domain-containing protein [Planctomycetota bacterium]